MNTPPAANVNPFTPTGMLLTSKKRTRSKRSLNGYVTFSFCEELFAIFLCELVLFIMLVIFNGIATMQKPFYSNR